MTITLRWAHSAERMESRAKSLLASPRPLRTKGSAGQAKGPSTHQTITSFITLPTELPSYAQEHSFCQCITLLHIHRLATTTVQVHSAPSCPERIHDEAPRATKRSAAGQGQETHHQGQPGLAAAVRRVPRPRHS